MGSLYNLVKKSQNMLIGRSGFLYNIRGDHTKLGNANNHKVNKLEKHFLVWTGKYKTVDEVPSFVQQNVVERARNRMRIRISNIMIAATAVGCLVMVYFGKKAAARGDSVAKQNLEWHRQYNEDATNKEKTA